MLRSCTPVACAKPLLKTQIGSPSREESQQQTQVRWRHRRDSKPTEPHYSGWDAKALITIEPYLLPFTAIAIKGDVGTAASAKQYAKI